GLVLLVFGVVRIDLGLRLVVVRGCLELDVTFREAPDELRAIGRLLPGAPVEPLEAGDFRDEEGTRTRLEARRAVVTETGALAHVRVRGLGVVLALLLLHRRRRALER